MKVKSHDIKNALKSLEAHPQIDSLEENDDLFITGVLDSLLLIQFVLILEEKFDIRLKNEDVIYKNFQTIGTLVEFLQKF